MLPALKFNLEGFQLRNHRLRGRNPPDGESSGVSGPPTEMFKLMAVSLKLNADSVEPSAPRELFPLPADDIGITPYEVAPDGQRFLVRATPQQAAQPLTVIVNWPALLKKGAAAQ
jgi:hypothetical protein